jgi:predicted lipid-binding transport protein (Tim44 family)
MQRDSLPQRPATPQRNADKQQSAPQQNAGAAASPGGKPSWLGPVAGIAAGLGLAALASHLGLGEEFASILLLALLVMGGLLLYRLLARGRTQPAAAHVGGLQYAGMGAGGGMAPPDARMPGLDAPLPPAGGAATLPADFDAEGFVRQAKLNFIRLQAAYDAGDLDDIRSFTTPQMYAEIKLQLDERGSAPQRTEVVTLDAEVIECVEETDRLVVSLRFHGLIREEADGPAKDFDEVWHLTRPASGKSGWVVAGIQQSI